MRISIIGKGGSGKTSIATALAHAAKHQVKNLVTIDADLNSHFGKYLGFSEHPKPLGEHFHTLIKQIVGDKLGSTYPWIGTIPPHKDANFIRVSEENAILNEYSVKNGSHYHLSSGTYHEEELGDACFHAKLNSLELLMHHTLDTDDDLILIDSAAGVDIVSTSMYLVPDLLLVVMEPTKKSLQIYHDLQEVLKDKVEKFQINIVPVFNKIETEQDIQFAKNFLKDPKMSFAFAHDENLIRFEQGEIDAIQSFIKKNEPELQKILKLAKQSIRPKEIYLAGVISSFSDECNAWANSTFRQDFSYLIDQEFKYSDIS